MMSTQSWIVQDLSNDRSFSVDVDFDGSLVGAHTLSVEVSSDDYPSISVYTISVPITVVSLCYSSVLQPPTVWYNSGKVITSPELVPQRIELMTSTTPTIITLPELVDSGTQFLQAFEGYESATCGTITYTIASSQSWIGQEDPTNDKIMSILVN